MSESSDDFGLAYIDSCDQLTLLCIHGFPFSSAMWEPQVEDLSGVARVIAPDLRGHGRSEAASPPYTMSMLADDCVGLLDFLGIESPVVVCGLSMGGYVAFEIYRQYPERVAGLILASTRAKADTPEGKAGRDATIEKAKKQGVTAVAADMLPKLLAPQTYEEDDEVADFVQEMMEGTSLEGMVGALQAMRDRPDSTPLLAEIDVPTLIIHGADDQLIPVAEARAMKAAIKGAQLVVIPDAGHLPNLEQIDMFSDAVIDFVDALTENDHDHEH
ncbi:MAG: alpha/beta fold hydrolase [Ardenticatenaceae bacterium]|nr:alpha/beta fold hydrolase [Ardenticatenaceae bacterium]